MLVWIRESSECKRRRRFIGPSAGLRRRHIMVTLMHALKQRGKKYGAAGICNGGGGASAMVIEAL